MNFYVEINSCQLREAASAVDYLHNLQLVHGDIKAANILVSDDGHALLTDFGLAKLSSGATSTGLSGAGTTRWQSPELFEGGRKTLESDIYAFGMLIVEVRLA
jgi:serine/threonine protein kinase